MRYYLRYPFKVFGYEYSSKSSKNKILSFFGDTLGTVDKLLLPHLTNFVLLINSPFPKLLFLTEYQPKLNKKYKSVLYFAFEEEYHERLYSYR